MYEEVVEEKVGGGIRVLFTEYSCRSKLAPDHAYLRVTSYFSWEGIDESATRPALSSGLSGHIRLLRCR